MPKKYYIVLGLLIVTLQACVYRMDIEQGNRVEQSALEQLQIGMTRKQVHLLLGEAAINDLHHPNQAHYVYYRYLGESEQTELKTMVLTYQDDVLTHIEGSL